MGFYATLHPRCSYGICLYPRADRIHARQGKGIHRVEVVSSDHSDFEVTELYPHIIPEKKAAEFLKKRFVAKPAPVGQLLLPPYRLHYADVVTFSLRSFLGVKSVRQEGIEL